jgi:hypothetical protein
LQLEDLVDLGFKKKTTVVILGLMDFSDYSHLYVILGTENNTLSAFPFSVRHMNRNGTSYEQFYQSQFWTPSIVMSFI